MRNLPALALYGAPLCPAGHLPHEGGDWRLRRLARSCDVGDWRNRRRRLISPLYGLGTSRTGVRRHREQFPMLA
ncbi:hypothetical protein FJ567_27335, partial [Mesorhizobium sp. B2-4-16]